MRLILKDYLLQLKEKDELDLLLCNLLLQKGYIPDNVPTTGNRQYGVDIQAHNKNELLLLVVKQKNLDRKVWAGDQNAVRQSIEEIFDVYLPFLSPNDLKKHIRIIVATNGVMEEAVRLNWNGFVKAHGQYNGIPIAIEFCGIDEITDWVEKELFSEYLFPAEMHSMLRKALYYIAEFDYKRIYFERIIDHYMDQIQNDIIPMHASRKKELELRKCLNSVLLASQMIAQYAQNEKRNRIAINVNEYLLIKFWKVLLNNRLLGKEKYCEWLPIICNRYEQASKAYYYAIKECCEIAGAFPNFQDTVERKFKLYEVVGYLASFAYYEANKSEEEAREIANTIITLINNHEEYLQPPLDVNIAQITMVCRVLIILGLKEHARILIYNHVTALVSNYKGFSKYPTPTDTYQDALDIELGNPHEDYETSSMWGYILLWIATFSDQESYEVAYGCLSESLKQVTKCIWFLKADEESMFYDAFAMNSCGEGVAVDVEKNYANFQKKMDFIMAQYKKEEYSFEKYAFPAIEFIICRYYGYIPRVKID